MLHEKPVSTGSLLCVSPGYPPATSYTGLLNVIVTLGGPRADGIMKNTILELEGLATCQPSRSRDCNDVATFGDILVHTNTIDASDFFYSL